MALAHAGSGDVVDLRPLGDALETSKTFAIVKTEQFEAVRLVMPAGTTIPQHQVEGRISLHCLEGKAILEHEENAELRPGDWVYLERNVPHSVRAVEDSSLLLTIMFDS